MRWSVEGMPWRENSKSWESEENERSQETHSLTKTARWTWKMCGLVEIQEERNKPVRGNEVYETLEYGEFL